MLVCLDSYIGRACFIYYRQVEAESYQAMEERVKDTYRGQTKKQWQGDNIANVRQGEDGSTW